MNPESTVITYDKSPALRKDCRFIGGQYYTKNKQCFLVNGKWNRVNNGKIIFDHEIQRWIEKSEGILRYGIVSVDQENNIELGYYTPNPLRNIIIGITGFHPPVPDGTDCMSEEIAEKLSLVEGIYDGRFYQESALDSEQIKAIQIRVPPQKNSTYRFPLEYGSERLIPEFSKSFDSLFKPKIELYNCRRVKFLEKYTWGIEFETSRGTIPERHLWPNGLIACRDGSISGFEYVTIPLRGISGVEVIYNIGLLLGRYTEVSTLNSLHIHIGNYPINMKSVIALYRLGTRIQNEIFEMFPEYYRNTHIFKSRDYCSPLKNVGSSNKDYKETFFKVYEQISGGHSFEGFNQKEHPMDISGRHKWNINPRYKYLNLIPLIFGDRKTVEFRVHSPTTNANKVVYWLFLLVAILAFAEKYQKRLIAGTISIDTSLNSIIEDHYAEDEELISMLQHYIWLRKSWFKSSIDRDGTKEVLMDHSFEIKSIFSK